MPFKIFLRKKIERKKVFIIKIKNIVKVLRLKYLLIKQEFFKILYFINKILENL